MTALSATPDHINIVALRPGNRQLRSSCETTRRRLIAWAESWQGEQAQDVAGLPPELAEALPDALEQARLSLLPGDPMEVMNAIRTLAERRGFELPNGPGLEMDVEVFSAWPRDLFRQAFRRIWETFAHRRMPEVADFHRHIAEDLAERQQTLHRLESVRLRLETARLKERWDAEARDRRLKLAEKERTAWA